MRLAEPSRRGLVLAARALAVVSVGVLVAVGLGPRTGAYQVLTVLSGSMKPSIPPGALVVVSPQSDHAVAVGQVLTFHAPVSSSPVVTHRVVEVLRDENGTAIRTKGDANAVPDAWTARLGDAPVWRVRAVVPGAGSAILWLRQDGVRRVTVFAFPIVLALLWLRWIWSAPPLRAVRIWETSGPPGIASRPVSRTLWETHVPLAA